MSKLKIFCGQGVGNLDYVLSALPRTDDWRQIPGQTNVSSLPRLINIRTAVEHLLEIPGTTKWPDTPNQEAQVFGHFK